MKATIDIDDALYRRLKVEAACRGRTVRELVADGVRRVLDTPDAGEPEPEAGAPPPWFGALRAYADNAAGAHDLVAVRRSITTSGRRRTADVRPRGGAAARRAAAHGLTNN